MKSGESQGESFNALPTELMRPKPHIGFEPMTFRMIVDEIHLLLPPN